MVTPLDEAGVIERFTPLLVLYPEIPNGTKRERNPNYPEESPLVYDYHPRDIRLVLENAGFHSRMPWRRGRTGAWTRMLDRMESAGYRRDLDLLPGTNPDDREAFWDAYAALPKDREELQRACYARVVPGTGINAGRVVVQYWYPYFYNDFWNTHEMDWEVVMVVLKLVDGTPRPTVCAYSAHMGGHWLEWPQVQKANEGLEVAESGTHPVAFVANGSHAYYFHGPAMYSTAPPLAAMAAKLLKQNRRLVDYTTSISDGELHLAKAKGIPSSGPSGWSGEWRWLNHKGKWGSPGEFFDFEFGDSGPAGPPEAGDKWRYPFRWIDTNCTPAPSMAESRVPTRIEPEEP